MSIQSRLIASISMAVLLLAAACQSPAATTPSATQAAVNPISLTIGLTFGSKSAVFLPVYLADEQGFFKAAQITPDLAQMSAASFVQAATAGEVKVGAISTSAAIQGIARGAPFKIVAISIVPPQWGLLGRNGANVAKPEDLKGKKIAIASPGGGSNQMALLLAERFGWNPQTDISMVSITSGEANIAALRQGEVDAVIGSIDRVYDYAAQGLGTVVFTFEELIPTWADNAIVAHNDLIEKEPETVQRFLRTYFQGANYYASNRESMIQKLMSDFRLSEAGAEKTYEKLIYTKDGSIDQKGLEAVAKSLLDVGVLDSPVDATTLYTTQFTPVNAGS